MAGKKVKAILLNTVKLGGKYNAPGTDIFLERKVFDELEKAGAAVEYNKYQKEVIEVPAEAILQNVTDEELFEEFEKRELIPIGDISDEVLKEEYEKRFPKEANGE